MNVFFLAAKDVVHAVQFCLALFKELRRNLREQSVRQNVFFLFVIRFDFFLELFILGRDKVGGTAGNSRLVAPDFLVKLGIGREACRIHRATDLLFPW